MKKWLPILLVLWLAFGLRVYSLTAVPPGLTHDEANHGREAIGILNGVWRYYFPLNYGSEPLYSYTVAGSMALLGKNLFALRLVNVIFNLLAIAATYAWAKRAFSERVGLLSAVLLAISFWPLANSRQALRAGMLPFFMVLAVWLFWKIAERQGSGFVLSRAEVGAEEQLGLPKSLTRSGRVATLPTTNSRTRSGRCATLLIPLFALLIAITFHIYLAARVAWLIFPAFVLYLALVNRARFRQVWPPTLLGLMLAGLLVTPMFLYLQNHPEVQTRLGMFRNPLGQFVSGDLSSMLQRAGQAFLAFFWPGAGDQFLAYNIPGRPTLNPITSLFFLLGLAVTIGFTIYDLRFTIHNLQFTIFRPSSPPLPLSPAPPLLRSPAPHPHTFLLLWFLIGIIPSLITGPTANTTRNLAALPAVYILPTLGFFAVADRVKGRWPVWVGTAVWLTFTLFTTGRDYFIRWGQSAEVRSAYQHTLIEELAYLAQRPSQSPVVISTVYPGPAHDSSIGLVMAAEEDTHWIDARWGLLLPGGRSPQLIIPQSTPPHPLFTRWLAASETITLRPDDLDPSFTLYNLDTAELQSWLNQSSQTINFNDAVALRQARWLADSTPPGGVAELLTIWQVIDPSRMGPLVPPAYTTDAKLFTHVLAARDTANSGIIAQQDLLSVPSWQWQTGDILLQIHQIWLAPEIAVGTYETAIGFYSESTGERVPIVGSDDDRAFVTSLQVAE